jgi:hypothetical protein
MPFNSRTANAARNRLARLHRAASWRKLGFPNLVLVRKARWKGHGRKRPDEVDLDIV